MLALCRYCACVASLRHLYLHVFPVFAVLLSLSATIGSMYNIQVLHIANQKRAPLLTCFPNKTEKNNTTMSTFSVLKFFGPVSYLMRQVKTHPTPPLFLVLYSIIHTDVKLFGKLKTHTHNQIIHLLSMTVHI